MFRSLYSNYGYRRPVASWNAADVMGPDGILQHGTVIGAGPDGLIVDFGCQSQQHQLVKYGEAFSYWHELSAGEALRPGRAVEVLLRRGHQNPWVWYPATLLAIDLPEAGHGKLAFVEVYGDGGVRREVVEYAQIRRPPSPTELGSRALQSDDFVVTSLCPLPAGIAGLSPTRSPLWRIFREQLSGGQLRPAQLDEQANIWILNPEHFVSMKNKIFGPGPGFLSPISVSSDEILLLQRKRGAPCYSPRSASQLENFIRQMCEDIDDSIEKDVRENGRLCCLRLAYSTTEVEESTPNILQTVHPHVLREMFTYLDTIERSAYRRVCRDFDTCIFATVSTDIRLTYQDSCWRRWVSCCSCGKLLAQYLIQAPLLKCVTARTRTIVLTNSSPFALSYVMRTLDICGQLGQCMADQVVVAVKHCDLNLYEFWENVDDLAALMTGGWCRQLLLKRMTLSASLPGLRFSGSVRGSSPQEDLCRMVENQLPAIDLPQMSQWVAQAVQGSLPGREDISTVLDYLTRPDPRASNAFAGYKWTPDNLAGLDVVRLSRLVLYALSQHVPRPPNPES